MVGTCRYTASMVIWVMSTTQEKGVVVPKTYESYIRGAVESDARGCEQDLEETWFSGYEYMFPFLSCSYNKETMDGWVEKWEESHVPTHVCDDAEFFKIRITDALRDPEEFLVADRFIIKRIQRSFSQLCEKCQKRAKDQNIWVYMLSAVLPGRERKNKCKEHSLRYYATGCATGRRRARQEEERRSFYEAEFGTRTPQWPRERQWWVVSDRAMDEDIAGNAKATVAYIVQQRKGEIRVIVDIGYINDEGDFVSTEVKSVEQYWLLRNYTLYYRSWDDIDLEKLKAAALTEV